MIEIEMGGKEDIDGPWKFLIAGFGGTGKTLLASTAPNPLFVFFSENPRLKSIADRYLPRTKLYNHFEDGALTISVQDQLKLLVGRLSLVEHEYETLVIDTADELYQKMREARRAKNGGEWGPSDWDWIAAAFREIITGLIDLPMHIIVLCHVKNVQDGDQQTRELMLQGVSTDEAPTWFDVVGVMDTFEILDDDGDAITKRVLLTHSSRLYPWVKDHSGLLPRTFEISENFVGDFDRMMKIIQGKSVPAHTEILETLPLLPEKEASGRPVPTPQEVAEKKQSLVKTPGSVEEGPVGEKEIQQESEEAKTPVAEEKTETEEVPLQVEELPFAIETEPVDQTSGEVSFSTAAEIVKEELGAEEVTNVCVVCGAEVADDMQELSQIRFRKILCRTHYKEAGDARK